MKKYLIAASILAMLGGGVVVAGPVAAWTKPVARDPGDTAVARASRALAAHRKDVAATGTDAFKVYSTHTDAKGTSHVRYTRTYQGLRVSGGDIVVHNKVDGGYAGASVGMRTSLAGLSLTPKVSAGAARSAARRHFKGKVARVGQPMLFIDATSGRGLLSWETVVTGVATDGVTPSRLHVITDATSGKFRGSFDEIKHVNGTGNSIYAGTVTVDTTLSGNYVMIDPSHGNGSTCDMNNGTSSCVNFTDADNTWGDGTQADRASAAVDAHYGAAKTFDYYSNVHGRNGIFGNGSGVPSRVHFASGYVNAFWDGAQMTYGDGEFDANPLVSLDVAGHEMTHGITENLVPGGLIYAGESGGLNEATSDIFGTMVEFYAGNASDPGDYLIGEEIDIFGTGDPLRYMYDPTLDGASHGCWSASTGSIDVHLSSGVANHFFFNLAEGTGVTAYGTSPVCGGAPAVTGIGRGQAELIWYRALNVYFTSTTRYKDIVNPANTARAYTLSAAADLYGLCSVQYKAVQAAWTAVNVSGSDDSCPTPNDFSVSLSPQAGSTTPGGSVVTAVNTALTNGSPETITFTVTTLPIGASVNFVPPSVTPGASSTLTISTTGATPIGVYSVTVKGTSVSNFHTKIYTLTVGGPPGCTGTNPMDMTISDLSVVESPIPISGCPGNASATSTVEVHIVHTFIGDLLVSLMSPDGSQYVLHNMTGGSADNIDTTYTVDLSSEAAEGPWRLRVQDTAVADTGYINTWTLTVGTTVTSACQASNDVDVVIPDLSIAQSPITLSGCTGNATRTSMIEVHIVHSFAGDLEVSLVAPDGTVYLLQDNIGGSSPDINRFFVVNLSKEARNGTWNLRVADQAGGDVGYIDRWALFPAVTRPRHRPPM